MDFELPEELRIFKQSLRRFVDNEMIPIERETTLPGGEKLKPEYYERFCKRAQDLGFWKMDIPEEYGGAGFSVLARFDRRDRAVAHHRAAGARHGPHHRAERARHSLFAHRRDEGKVSACRRCAAS